MSMHVRSPAKVNLALKVLGRQPDGFHRISSLVGFTEFGDEIAVRRSNGNSLLVHGPFADAIPHDDENLVLKALGLIAGDHGFIINLVKHIPVAAGLGGGSSNAATAIRLASKLTGAGLPGTEQVSRLGTDIPVCLIGKPAMIGGLGEIVRPLQKSPQLYMLLVNPMVQLSTGLVYQQLGQYSRNPLEDPPSGCDPGQYIDWLGRQKNDLEKPAMDILPVIGDVLDSIRETSGCLLARMSGSGATCFGLYASSSEADHARKAILSERRGWWSVSTVLTGVGGLAD